MPYSQITAKKHKAGASIKNTMKADQEGVSLRISEILRGYLGKIARRRTESGSGKAILFDLPTCSFRLGDGFDDVPPLPPTDGPPGSFQDTGTANSMPNQAYATTTPFLLPRNLSSVSFSFFENLHACLCRQVENAADQTSLSTCNKRKISHRLTAMCSYLLPSSRCSTIFA